MRRKNPMDDLASARKSVAEARLALSKPNVPEETRAEIKRMIERLQQRWPKLRPVTFTPRVKKKPDQEHGFISEGEFFQRLMEIQ